MYSNCLFEAIKAKFKDPKNIKIIILPKTMNRGFPHILWISKKDNTIHHFVALKQKHCRFFFEGKYKIIDFTTFESWVLDRNKNCPKNIIKYAKKVGFNIANMSGIFDYEYYFQDIADNSIWYGKLPSQEDIDFLKKVLKLDDILIKVNCISKSFQIMKLQDALSLKEEVHWKYITPFDIDYIEIYGPQISVHNDEVI